MPAEWIDACINTGKRSVPLQGPKGLFKGLFPRVLLGIWQVIAGALCYQEISVLRDDDDAATRSCAVLTKGLP